MHNFFAPVMDFRHNILGEWFVFLGEWAQALDNVFKLNKL